MARKVRKTEVTRISGEMKNLINRLKARYLMSGRTPPTTSQITKVIATKTNEEELWYDIKIKF
jgi:hypothetical protein